MENFIRSKIDFIVQVCSFSIPAMMAESLMRGSVPLIPSSKIEAASTKAEIEPEFPENIVEIKIPENVFLAVFLMKVR